MEPVRFAQLGVAQPHADGFRETLALMPEVALVAGYDPDPVAARKSLRAPFADCPIYDDIATLLAQAQPEAVLISLPHAIVPAAIIAAAEAGCHVYVEKPGARSAAEFHPAKDALVRANRQFATGYLRHYSPVALAIKEIITQGLLGRLVSAEARLITTSVARRDPTHWLFQRESSGGGIVSWLGCHWLDFLRWSTDSEVTKVTAIMDTLSGEAIDVEDTAVLALRYTNGMIGSLHCAYVTDKAADQWFVALRGTHGWLNWDKSGPEFTVHSTHPAWQTAPTRTLRFEGDTTGGYGGAMGVLTLRRFIESFRAGGPPAFLPEDALRVLEVLDAAQESSRTGRHVTIGGH